MIQLNAPSPQDIPRNFLLKKFFGIREFRIFLQRTPIQIQNFDDFFGKKSFRQSPADLRIAVRKCRF